MYTIDEENTREAYNSGETWPSDDPWRTLTHQYVTAQVQHFLAVSTFPESQILNAGAADTRYTCLGTVYDCDIAEKKLSTSQHPIHASITELPCQSSYHQSHLKKQQDYGHQAVGVMLSCNGLSLNYAIVL